MGIFIFTGNMILGGWIIYIATPLYNLLFLDDNRNLDKQDEKKFMTNQLFLVPLYAMILSQLLLWVYCLALFSTEYLPKHWIFDNKPETYQQYILFAFTVSFFHSISSASGHELVHHKAFIHKFVGSIPFAQCFYSHFGEEHVKNHHKNVGISDLDPVCHPVGRSFYEAYVRSVVGTHVSTWKRENNRIKAKNKDVSTISMLW